ncbi:glycerol-3-phosphate dehydrogenase [Litorimonas sp.]|uniref:glycerol-3-phosphate dehydrogenase n=1 Tax=Litorimonas sp. TaxID=1892381 RepID=UPI003A8A5579
MTSPPASETKIPVYDLLVIGGGINGTAVARDAAGRGLSVVLCEKDDLASHTSSASTKLIHGGLRYLEHYDFKLVRESLKEREILLRAAPHIIWPLRFILPYDEGLRPKWLLRMGLFLYDNLGGRELLPGTKTRKRGQGSRFDVLKDRLETGFEYSDCWVEDSRLVALNAVDAAQQGADIFTRTEVRSIKGEEGLYRAEIQNGVNLKTIKARGIVNAAGPWVDSLLSTVEQSDVKDETTLRLVKGSHIVVPKLYDGDHAFIFQNSDERVIFAIPYEQNFTLIGTTDVPHEKPDDLPQASAEEIQYLCDCVNEYFETQTTPTDVVWTYSGVRPLYDDKAAEASDVTRDYVLDLQKYETDAPFISVYGGKITTSRKLADHVLEKIKHYYPDMGKPWTKKAYFPGGNIPEADFEEFYQSQLDHYPDLDPKLVRLFCRRYGTRVTRVLKDGVGRLFGGDLTEADARYLVEYEWAKAPEDVLWRRTKCGLHMSESERESFAEWFRHAKLN